MEEPDPTQPPLQFVKYRGVYMLLEQAMERVNKTIGLLGYIVPVAQYLVLFAVVLGALYLKAMFER